MARKKKKKAHRESSPPLPVSTLPDAFEPTPAARWQPVVILKEPAARPRCRCAEVTGGAAADCAAVCCWLLKLLVMASVRPPAGFCRRAARAIARRRERVRKRNEARLLDSRARSEAERASLVASAEGLEWPGGMAAAEVAGGEGQGDAGPVFQRGLLALLHAER